MLRKESKWLKNQSTVIITRISHFLIMRNEKKWRYYDTLNKKWFQTYNVGSKDNFIRTIQVGFISDFMIFYMHAPRWEKKVIRIHSWNQHIFDDSPLILTGGKRIATKSKIHKILRKTDYKYIREFWLCFKSSGEIITQDYIAMIKIFEESYEKRSFESNYHEELAKGEDYNFIINNKIPQLIFSCAVQLKRHRIDFLEKLQNILQTKDVIELEKLKKSLGNHSPILLNLLEQDYNHYAEYAFIWKRQNGLL